MIKRILIVCTLGLLLASVGVAWADESAPKSGSAPDLLRAVIVRSEPSPDSADFRIYTVKILEGADKGTEVTIGDNEMIASVGYTVFKPGDRVVLGVIDKAEGGTAYIINDYERRGSLLWLVILFVTAVIWFNRWRGVRSLVGLAASYLVIISWIVPQIVAGHDPVRTAIIGGAVILIATLLLTEGWRRSMWAAAAGVVATMLVIGLLSQWSIGFTHLTGGASEEAFSLQNMSLGNINVRGLLMAGFIIGTLGILDDIAVSQVAVVAELRRSNIRQSRRSVYQAALRVGRSHMAAITNTLVLAYAGVSLPLLVLFQAGQAEAGLVLNSELVATEIVRSVVGSLGLVLAVPLTTAIAVWFNVKSSHPDVSHEHSVAHQT